MVQTPLLSNGKGYSRAIVHDIIASDGTNSCGCSVKDEGKKGQEVWEIAMSLRYFQG